MTLRFRVDEGLHQREFSPPAYRLRRPGGRRCKVSNPPRMSPDLTDWCVNIRVCESKHIVLASASISRAVRHISCAAGISRRREFRLAFRDSSPKAQNDKKGEPHAHRCHPEAQPKDLRAVKQSSVQRFFADAQNDKKDKLRPLQCHPEAQPKDPGTGQDVHAVKCLSRDPAAELREKCRFSRTFSKNNA